MKRTFWIMVILAAVSLLVTLGCKTTEPQAEVPAGETESEISVQEPSVQMGDTADTVTASDQEPAVEPVELREDIVIHVAATGNVQGELFGTDLVTGERRAASLSRFYSYLEQLRFDYGENLILLDHGNAIKGSFITSYWNAVKSPEQEHIIATVMNAMGYQAAAAGNLDLGLDARHIGATLKDFNFPVLSANLIYSDSKESVLPSHTILNIGEISVAVIGVMEQTSSLPEEYELIDAVQAVNNTVSEITADAVVVLVSGSMQLSEKIASESRGVDVIIGGDRLASRLNRVNQSVHIVGTRPYAGAAAAAGLVFSWTGEEYRLVGVEATMADVSSYQPSSIAVDAFAPVVDELEQVLMTRVGYLTDTIDTRVAQFKDSALVDLIHEMQLEISGADVSFASAPVTGVPLLEGPLYVRDVLHALRMLDLGERLPTLYILKMTGKEIDAYLEHSYGMWFATMSSIDDQLLKGREFELYDTAAGFNYIVDVRAPAGDKVKITTNTAGEKFIRDNTYSVVINEFRFNDLGGYFSEGLGFSAQDMQQRIQRVIRLDLVESLKMQEAMLGSLEPSSDENWFASPRIWAQRAAQKEGLEL